MRLKVLHQLKSKIRPENIIALLLKQRGIKPAQAEIFFHPAHPSKYSLTDLSIPIKQVNKTIKRLVQAFTNKEKVVVFTDYDADGIMSGVIAWQSLYDLGFQVMPYIPDRKTEGYGFSKQSLINITNQYKPNLIITIDHGITGQPYLYNLKKQGIDTIVIDHHEPINDKPVSAYTLIHSKALCAAGLSFYLIQDLLIAFQKKRIVPNTVINKLKNKQKLDHVVYAGIATITDQIPLIGIARSLAFHSLELIDQINNIGFRKLLESVGLSGKEKYTANDIGFVIGPKLNAVGRFGHALDAVRLLCTKDKNRADQLVKLTQIKNKERKEKAEIQIKEAEKLIAKQKDELIYFIFSEKFDEGILGLLAARLAEKYYRPVLVGSLSKGTIKGSARSINGFNITQALLNQKKWLESYGGHAQAAGFVLRDQNSHLFLKHLRKYVKENTVPSVFEPQFSIDLEVQFNNISHVLAEKLEQMEPFGDGNRQPLFISQKVKLLTVRTVGKTGEHLQMVLCDSTNPRPIKAIYFFGQNKQIPLLSNCLIQVIYHLEVDRWREPQPVLRIKHLKLVNDV